MEKVKPEAIQNSHIPSEESFDRVRTVFPLDDAAIAE